MLICQNCGEKAKMKWKANEDPDYNFFMWPSHTNERGLNIFGIFCFSCGTLNEGASKLFSTNYEYFKHSKLDPSALKRWCLSRNVSEPIISKLRDSGFIE